MVCFGDKNKYTCLKDYTIVLTENNITKEEQRQPFWSS